MSKKKVRVAINGFGRIGRTAFKIWYDKHRDTADVVAVNDLTDTKTLAHLLKHDSNYGLWEPKVSFDETNIIVDGVKVPVYSSKDPATLPWKELDVDVVIESTGKFTDPEGAGEHLKAGAKRIVLSAPAKSKDPSTGSGQGGEGAVKGVTTVVLGVNEGALDNAEPIISNASCTTNNIAPVASVLHDAIGIKKSMMTTIHSYTQDQMLQDGPHKDLRRARAAAQNIVPTTTGATIAATEAIPELKGLFNGLSIRVPTPVVSLADFTFLMKRKTTAEEINKILKNAADKNPRFKGILGYTEDPVVSSDFVGDPRSSIVDISLTQVVDGDMVKVIAWYDNEYGYSNRLVEAVIEVGKRIK